MGSAPTFAFPRTQGVSDLFAEYGTNCTLEGPARAGSKAGYRVRLVLLLPTISGKQLTEGVGRFEVLCTGPRRYHRWRSQGVLDGADIAPLLRELLPRCRVFHRVAGAVVLTFSLCDLQVQHLF